MAMLERPSESLALQTELAEAISRLPFPDAIYLPTEKVPLPQQIAGLKIVDEIYRERLHTIYRPRLQALRAQFRNRKRAFIIGNGPSLRRTDLSALKDEVTFAVNGFFLKFPELPWRPTFYVVEDHLVAEDRADAINALSGPTKLFPVSLAYCINEGLDTIFFDHRPRTGFPDSFDFSLDASEATYTGCTVTNTVLQLAHYLGFHELYLIGVDASYELPADVQLLSEYNVGVLDMKSDDPNHFHPDYFGKGFRWHEPQVDKMVQAYREAERITRKTGRLIYNATVGGNLEVFQRVDYFDVLPQASRETLEEQDGPDRIRALAGHPRLLVLDMTRIGDGTATGEVKKMLLRHWPKEKLMQVYSASASQIGLNFSIDGTTWSPDPAADAELNARLAAFRPEMILYRPVADQPGLHDCAMRVIRDHDLPLALWVMDDWMHRLQQADPALHDALDADLRGLIGKASALFAISAPMAAMLAERYGGTWQVFSNAIDPEDWTAKPPGEPGTGLAIRYAGNLAEDMTLDSLRRVARVVDRLAEAHDISLQINTRPFWADQAGYHFDGLRNVTITTTPMQERAYRAWLSGGDAVLIAYNFDPLTMSYVRYSMANKLPECLASGAVTLVYGPRGIATIDALDESGCAHVVTDEDEETLRGALLWLLQNREARLALAARARAHAVRHHDLAPHAERFREAIRSAVAARPSTTGPAQAPVLAVPAATDEAILRELKLLRTELFANWIATASSQRSMSEEVALNAGLTRLRQDLGQIQESMADKERRDALLLRKIANLTEQVGAVTPSTAAPPVAEPPQARGDSDLNATLAQLRQELIQIQEDILDNERRGALTLKRVAGLASHIQSIPVNPPASSAFQDSSSLRFAIAQLHRELTDIRESVAENERRDTLMLRKAALLADQVTAHPPSLPASPRKRSAIRSIRRLPARLVKMATGRKGNGSTRQAQERIDDGASPPASEGQGTAPQAVPASEGEASFSVRTEWVDLKFDEVGIVLVWSLEGRPIASTLAVRQQDLVEVKIETLASDPGETVAPFSLIVSTEGRSSDELVGDLSTRLEKRLAGARNATSTRFLGELSRHLPEIVRTIV